MEEVLRGRQRELALLVRPFERFLEAFPEVAPLALQLQRVVEHPDGVLGKIFGDRREAARIEAGKDRREPGGEKLVVLRVRAELVDQFAQLA